MKPNQISQSWSQLLKRSGIVVAAILIPLSLTQCASAFERVVDHNGKPLEGVTIIKSWRADVWNPVDARSRCTGAAMGFTNKEGIFPHLTNPRWWWGGEQEGFTIFKRGYKLKRTTYPGLNGASGYAANDVYTLESNEDEYDKILFQMGRNPEGCGGDILLKRDGMCTYLKDVAEDRIRLAKTNQQRDKAGGAMLRAIECETGKTLSIEESNAILRQLKL
jgi:hypothetical protein